MLTNLQKSKMTHLFKIMDFDHNGFIQLSDLTGITDNICIIKGVMDGSPIENILEIASKHIWKSLSKFHEREEIETCSLEDWLLFIDHYLVNRDEPVIKFYAERLAENLFDVFDQNDDGMISKLEYMAIFISFRVDIKQTNDCFGRLDLNSDGFISYEEFTKAVFEYIKSDNPDDPGNYIFGDIENYYFSTRKINF